VAVFSVAVNCRCARGNVAVGTLDGFNLFPGVVVRSWMNRAIFLPSLPIELKKPNGSIGYHTF